MRLTELNPRWVTHKEVIVGLWFDCPSCRRPCRIYFTPMTPTDFVAGEGKYVWQCTGTTFDDLSLQPSIDFSKHGCWHGYITNGDISFAGPQGGCKPQ